MSDVWFVVALTIVLVLYAGSMLQLKFGLAGVFGTQLLLLTVPLVIVIYTKRDIRLTYALRKTAVSNFLAGALIITGVFLINIVISTGLVSLFPESAENVVTVFDEILSGNIGAVLFVIALAPAVCEEMLFRGIILQSMKAKYRIGAAIGITAALFGIYHMSLIKLIPTALLGFVLCYVAYRADSIYPAMLMHFMNNAFSVVISCYPEKIETLFPVFYQDDLYPGDVLLLLGAGLIFAGAGLYLLKKGNGQQRRQMIKRVEKKTD